MFCDFQSSVRLQEGISPKVFVFLFPQLFALFLVFFSIFVFKGSSALGRRRALQLEEHCSAQEPGAARAAQLRSISRALPAGLWWCWLCRGEIPVQQQRKLPNYEWGAGKKDGW